MNWKSIERVLYRNANIHSSVSPFATAMLVNGDEIAWLGEESAVAAHHDSADRVIDMSGAFIAPVFVDAYSSALDHQSIHEAREQAASFGIGAFHDFSESDWQAVDATVVDHAGSLVYPYRAELMNPMLGVLTSASDVEILREAIERHISVSVVATNNDVSVLLENLEALVQSLGLAQVKAADLRLDGVHELSKDQLQRCEALGIVIVANPSEFQSAATAVGLGNSIAFGSHSENFSNPWSTLRSAVFEFPEHERMTARAAFSAATRGGWRAVGRTHIGVIAPGAPAHFAVWDATDVVVQTPDERVAGWSTDPRSGTPGLPDVAPGVELPQCLRTVIAGAIAFDSGALPK